MSQLRVTSLLASRKSGVEPRDGALRAKSPLTTTAANVKPALVVEQVQTDPALRATTDDTATTLTRVTRSRANSLKTNIVAQVEVASPSSAISSPVGAESDSPASARQADSTAVGIVVGKRKTTASNLDTYITSTKKAKVNDDGKQQVSESSVPAQAAQPAAPPVPSLTSPLPSADAIAEMDLTSALVVDSDPTLSLDEPFALPPLEAVPAPAPVVAPVVAPIAPARPMSRGTRVVSRIPGGIGRAPINTSATGMAVTPATAAAVRAANGMHSDIMAMLDSLAPMPPRSAAPTATTIAPSTLPTSSPARVTPAVASRSIPSPAAAPSSSASLLAAPRLPGLSVLPFPTHFTFLLGVFSGIDSTLSMLLYRNKALLSCRWHAELHVSVERVVGRQVTLAHLQQLMTIYPASYQISEQHTVDSFGKLQRDYNISFGAANGRDEDTESKLRLAAAAGIAADSIDPARLTCQNANLTARRAELEQRMKQYVYEQHQAFLQKTMDDATSSSSSSSPLPLSSADLGSIAVMLQTPLSRMPVWHPTFHVDLAAHVTPLALTPLPDRNLAQMLANAAAKATPISLKQLALKKQAVPQTISLQAENRGGRHTNHSSIDATLPSSAAAASPAAAAASSSVASSTPPIVAPALTHRSLSVLSAEVRARLSTAIHTSQVAALKNDGDPALRDQLRKVSKLKPLYEAIKLRLKMEKNRANMPLPELLTKLRAANATDFGDAVTVRMLLGMLAEHLPHWCTIGSSGRPPVDVLRTHRSGELDSVTKRDRNLPILQKLVEQHERKMRPETTMVSREDEDEELRTVRTETDATEVRTQGDNTAAVSDDVTEVRVKLEGETMQPAVLPAAAAAAAASTPAVKVEESVKTEQAIAAASHHASLVHAATGARLAAAGPSSPAKRVPNVSSRAALLARTATATSKPAAANAGTPLSRMR